MVNGRKSKKPKSKKDKQAERTLNKIQKHKDKREKRKELNKLKKSGTQVFSQQIVKTNVTEVENTVEDKEEPEYPPDRFALLRPPPVSDSEDDEIPELVAEKKNDTSLEIDHLEVLYL